MLFFSDCSRPRELADAVEIHSVLPQPSRGEVWNQATETGNRSHFYVQSWLMLILVDVNSVVSTDRWNAAKMAPNEAREKGEKPRHLGNRENSQTGTFARPIQTQQYITDVEQLKLTMFSFTHRMYHVWCVYSELNRGRSSCWRPRISLGDMYVLYSSVIKNVVG